MGNTPVELVAVNVKKARLRRRWSQEKLAGKCGIARPRISELESGYYNPTVSTVGLIATAMDLPIATLFRKSSIKAN